MELKDLEVKLTELKTSLETTLTQKAKDEITNQLKAISEDVKALKDAAPKADPKVAELENTIKELKAAADANQPVIDAFVKNPPKKTVSEKKSFGDAFSEEIANVFESKQAEIKAFQKDRNAKLSIELKTVGNMLLSSNLTGDGVASYNSRQGLVPSQKTNFRDLIPTTQSPTGLYVTYRETGTEGEIGIQTEGSAKAQIDYDLTEVKVVSDYIAGYARFSKQMMFQLPFLQNTLQRMLLRDFYKKENSTFFGIVSAAATGSTTTTATVDAEQLIDYIANQLAANFNPSFGLVSFAQWSRLLRTKPSDYSVPGGVMIDPNGNIRIAGVQIIGASWVTDDKVLIIDSDYLERVETEGLRVDFSYDDADNFTKNLVTARVECFEDINMLRVDSNIYADFGNAS